MRFGLIHRIMTDALAALGVLAVVSTASLSHWTNLVLLAGLAVALVIPDSWQTRPALRHFATLAPLALLILQGARLVAGRSPLDVAVEFAALLQIIRLATRRGAAHDQQIIVLALLHFIAGTVLGGGLTYGLCFLGFLVVAPGALVLSHLRREVEGNYRQGARDRTGLPVDVPRILRSRRVVGRGFLGATCLLAVPILFFTTALFLVFPRIGLSLLLLSHPHAGRMVGFSEHVDLGDVGTLRDDPTIALRFELAELPDPPPPRKTLRLRGTALDRYDGHAWLRTQRDTLRPITKGVDDSYPIFRSKAPDDHVMSIFLEPIDPPVVFLPPRAVALRVRMPNAALLGEPLSIQRGADGEIRYGGAEARGLTYDVFFGRGDEGPPDPLPPEERDRYLVPPPDLPLRIAELAHAWTDRFPTAREKAVELERRLSHDFTYDVHSPSGGKPQPLDDFLFVSRRGHCEFFSTAMAIMLRTLGVPSRNVTGFVGGTWNRFGRYYAVREGDAHSWVEAYLDDAGRPAGWQTFDPTPTSGAQPMEPPTGAYYYLRDFVEALSQRWNTYVVGYDFHKQVRLFEDVSRRYDKLRGNTGLRKGPLGALTGPLGALASLALAMVAYGLWKRRRGAGEAPPVDRQDVRRPDPGREAIVALFCKLETALHKLGITRPRSLPPLRHAEDLATHGHPLGPEIVSLTHVYLEARFGGKPLTESTRHDFARRIRELAAPRRTRLPAA
jgi:transglutaminase-like putative cysteine protease